MATLQEQRDAIAAAIGQGAQIVHYADGRSVTYRTVKDLLDALAFVDSEIAAAVVPATVPPARLLIATDRGL